MADFLPGDVGRDIAAGVGLATITAYNSATSVQVTVTQGFDLVAYDAGDWTLLGTPQATCTPLAATPVGKLITLSLDVDGFRPEDAGKYVEINGGLVKLGTYYNARLIGATILVEMTAPVASPPFGWRLMGSVWGGAYGYPRCGTLYEQRLWQAGSTAFPQRVWGSAIGEPLNYQLGTFDDEAMAYDVASSEMNPILHLADATGLLALTFGGEFSIAGGSDKAITPTNLQVKSQSNYGCSAVPPERVGTEIFFTQRAGRKVRALSQNIYNTERYDAPDLSVLAEHVTESGLLDMAFQQEPSSLLFMVRNDGQLPTLTIDRDQEVVAFTRQLTQGLYESVESIPGATGDVVFCVVARIINGALTRFIELMDPSLQTDAALTGSSATGATVWTGLGHLEGRTVDVKGDGVALSRRVVTGGSITTERPVFALEVGLNYVTTIKTLTPELTGNAGSSAGAAYSISKITVRLHESLGCTVNYQQIPFKTLGNGVLDKAPALFTGDKVAGNLGWADGVAQTVIQQVLPYPLHVLAVITTLTINDG